MAATPTITVAGPPTTLDVVQEMLASMAALSGVATDYNTGSQIRTFSEAAGAVVEQQGVAGQALALQALAYSAMGAFGIVPNAAVSSAGIVTFATSSLPGPPPAVQPVAIPAGALVQTAGGVQFATTTAATLASGSSSVDIPVQAVLGGAAGNVPAQAITQLISGLTFPLAVSNASPTTGGASAETPAMALNRLSAVIASLVGGSPVGVANFAIGIQNPGTSETVQYATCYEPWVAAGSGAGSGTAGFDLYVDNGTGSATSGLLAAVTTAINGNQSTGAIGYRPAGVPFSVLAVSAVYANVTVSGSLSNFASLAAVSGAIASGVSGYFTALQFGDTAEQASIAAVAGNAALGLLTSLSVFLYYASNPSSAVTGVTGVPYSRIILQSLTVTV